MQFRSRWLSVYMGPDHCRQLDAMVFIGVGEMQRKHDGALIEFPLEFWASWDWLPGFSWIYWEDDRSSSWTGRYRELQGWSWTFCAGVH